MQHEKKLISHIADRLWGKATSIELVCMREGKLKYGLGSQMPASAIGCFGYGGWNVFSVYMCVCQRVTDADSASIEWFSNVPPWSYFPITSYEQEWHRWSECFKRKSNLKEKPSHSSLEYAASAFPTSLLPSWTQIRASSLTICHVDVFKSCMHAEFRPVIWTGQVPGLCQAAQHNLWPREAIWIWINHNTVGWKCHCPKVRSNFADTIWPIQMLWLPDPALSWLKYCLIWHLRRI